MASKLMAGSAVVDITPKASQFLCGYPHVERYSTGVNDPLLSSALYLSDGTSSVIFVANDIVYVTKASAHDIRQRITAQTGIAAQNIMITATHTHSGPITIDALCAEADPVVPGADKDYVRFMEDRIVEAAVKAFQNAQPAGIGLGIADSHGVGTNRRSPDGPADHQVPVLLVQNDNGTKVIACMLVCSMHPTVLHEDSKLVSADFPGYSRKYLQEHVFGRDCAVLHHTGPSGNQSPRHVTRANTFAEAQRIGEILGKAVEKVVPTVLFDSSIPIKCDQAMVELPPRTFPPVAIAQEKLNKAVARLDHLRKSNAPRQDVRTAECDWFGAEETLTLAKAVVDGRVARACRAVMPAEIQMIKIGHWAFIGWQGEVFVDYALALKRQFANAFVISMANGELQGYIVTKEAADEGGYEASNAMFSYESGDLLVRTSIALLQTS
jgi:neutral ceramidase